MVFIVNGEAHEKPTKKYTMKQHHNFLSLWLFGPAPFKVQMTQKPLFALKDVAKIRTKTCPEQILSAVKFYPLVI